MDTKIDEALVAKVAREALKAVYKNERMTQLAQDAADHAARKALRASLKPFMEEEPPGRTVDDPTTYFRLPGPGDPNSVIPVLAPNAPHPRTPAERKKYGQEFFALIFKHANLTLEDLHPHRIRVFYRIIRHFARKTHPAADALADLDIAAWTSLMPPAAPEPLPADYDPMADSALKTYLQALADASGALQIHKGTKKEPHLGHYGLKGLLDAWLVRLAVPSPIEVLEWEKTLTQDTLKAVLRLGVTGTYDWLKRTHGLQEPECQDLVRSAKGVARTRATADTEDDRAIMVLRLEELRRRVRRIGLNPATELGALKLQALVQGFGRVEPENAISDFVAVVRRVNEEESVKVLEMDDTTEDEIEKE